MSITINGATNTLTAASGLTIAGNTAVTGTLSASGLLTANGGSPGNPSLATQYQMSVGTDIVLNPSGYGVVVSGSRVVAIDTTGLAVTGSATVGTGAASTFGNLILNGAAQANHGSYITFQRNSATVGYVGQRASVIGSGSNAEDMAYFAGTGLGHYWYVNGSVASSMSLDTTGLTVTGTLSASSHILPTIDNTSNLGSAALGMKELFSDNGTINTSDARRKTEVSALSAAEINAAKQLAKEIGSFKFLSAVAEKGDAARLHIGMTVQRAIEIMEGNGLDPFAYSFICHDVWQDVFVDHPAVDAIAAQEAVLDEDGNVITPAVDAVEGQAAWTEQTQVAGDKYSFRVHELLLFMAAGFEARLSALEAA